MLHRLATIHAVGETQSALGDELPVRQTLERLQTEGLDRQEAVHAIGSILARHIHGLLTDNVQPGDQLSAYWTALEDLTADGWRRAR